MRDGTGDALFFHQQRERHQYPQGMIHYGMTKTAQLAVRVGGRALRWTGVTVNSILQGRPALPVWKAS